jgi:hypothetical protein
MNVPTIYDILKISKDEILQLEQDIQELKKDPLNSYIVNTKESELKFKKKTVDNVITKIREEKINNLFKQINYGSR